MYGIRNMALLRHMAVVQRAAWRLQAAHFPAPEHRTAALAAQAAALYLALWFVPRVLHSDAALMRALVDRCAAPPPSNKVFWQQYMLHPDAALMRALVDRCAALPSVGQGFELTQPFPYACAAHNPKLVHQVCARQFLFSARRASPHASLHLRHAPSITSCSSVPWHCCCINARTE